jgi:hypothetical protein
VRSEAFATAARRRLHQRLTKAHTVWVTRRKFRR